MAEPVRHHGIGKLLMHNLYETAAKHHCSRVEWTTDRENRDAQQFYSKIGIPENPSKLFYRIEGEHELLGAIARTATGQG